MVPLRPEVLAARLQELGIASAEQLQQAQAELAATQERFSAILVRLGVIRDADIGKRLAPQLGSVPQRLSTGLSRKGTVTPGVASEAVPHGSIAAARVPPAVWSAHRLAPVAETNGRLLVATDDPFSVFALEFFARRCGCPLDAVLVTEQDMAQLLGGVHPVVERSAAAAERPPGAPAMEAAGNRTAEGTSGMPRAGGSGVSAPSAIKAANAVPVTSEAGVGEGMPPARGPAADRAAIGAAKGAPGPAGRTASAGDDAIIQLVDSMLSEAVRMRASDIHVEPWRQQLQVRYRVDGVLHDVNSPPAALQGPLISRIKIMAGLNIAEKRLPQDGRLQLDAEGRLLDLRISILPSMHGESIVMRLLDRSQPLRGLKELGLSPEDHQGWEALVRRPHGMVLVTGPTGSGKTTTLYGALSMLNQTDRKLITIEDPVEYQLPGVNQVVVKASIGLTFAAGLRSMLRQAPDVIMVGEIRDQETAQIAVQAALTGHLVLSTLHTNDAPSAVTRLIDMGIAPFLVASTLQGVLAQRLVRKLCESCRMTDHATAEERAFLGPPEIAQVIRSTGCERCHDSGYLGRIGLFELLSLNDAIRQLVVRRSPASQIRQAAREHGMRSLREDGALKVREGLTMTSEVLRVVME